MLSFFRRITDKHTKLQDQRLVEGEFVVSRRRGGRTRRISTGYRGEYDRPRVGAGIVVAEKAATSATSGPTVAVLGRVDGTTF